MNITHHAVKSLGLWQAQYGASHRNPINKMLQMKHGKHLACPLPQSALSA